MARAAPSRRAAASVFASSHAPPLPLAQRAFNPKVLYCYAKLTHQIAFESRYLLRPNKEDPNEPGITFCLKCFKEQKQGGEIFVDDVGNGERCAALHYTLHAARCTAP